MKRIFFITSEFPPLPGGIGNHAYHLALALVKQGYTVLVLTDQRSANLSQDLAFDASLPFQVQRIPRSRFVFWTYWQRVYQAIRLGKQYHAETVILSGKFSLWLGGMLTLLYAPFTLAVIHGSELKAGGFMSRFFTRWSLSRFTKVVAVSRFTAELVHQVKSHLPLRVINNGFAMEKVSFVQRNPEPLRLVTVGNVTYRKGQQNVIRALPLLALHYPSVHYDIVGLPTEQKAFSALALSLGVSDRVTFHGALDASSLREVLEQSTLFMMLSDQLQNGDVEGFGIAVLEANSMGIPALGSQNSGIADAITTGCNGILVPPHHPESILAAVSQVLQDYEGYQQRAIAWSERFRWDDIVLQYLECLKHE